MSPLSNPVDWVGGIAFAKHAYMQKPSITGPAAPAWFIALVAHEG